MDETNRKKYIRQQENDWRVMFEDSRPFLVTNYCMLHWHIFLVACNVMFSRNTQTENYIYIYIYIYIYCMFLAILQHFYNWLAISSKWEKQKIPQKMLNMAMKSKQPTLRLIRKWYEWKEPYPKHIYVRVSGFMASIVIEK